MILPIHLASPAKDFPPHSYVIRKYSQLCRCGTLHEFCEIFAKTHIKPRLGAAMGKSYITNLRPVKGPEEMLYNLPVSVEIMAQHPSVPTRLLVCYECIAQDSLSHLPPAPAITEPVTAPELRATPFVKNSTPPRTRYWKGSGDEQTERYEDVEQLNAPKTAKTKATKPTTPPKPITDISLGGDASIEDL